MKVLVFALVVSVIGTYAVPVEQDDLVDKVNTIIDQLLVQVPDAVEIKDKAIEIYSGILQSAEITINEVSLSGVKDLVTKLSYNEETSRLNYTFSFEDIGLVANVTLKLQGIFNLDHTLSAEVALKGLQNEGYALVSTDDVEKEVTDLTVAVILEESNFDIQGLLDNDDLSKKISEFLTEHVTVVAKAIDYIVTPHFTRIVKDIINSALKSEE